MLLHSEKLDLGIAIFNEKKWLGFKFQFDTDPRTNVVNWFFLKKGRPIWYVGRFFVVIYTLKHKEAVC